MRVAVATKIVAKIHASAVSVVVPGGSTIAEPFFGTAKDSELTDALGGFFAAFWAVDGHQHVSHGHTLFGGGATGGAVVFVEGH